MTRAPPDHILLNTRSSYIKHRLVDEKGPHLAKGTLADHAQQLKVGRADLAGGHLAPALAPALAARALRRRLQAAPAHPYDGHRPSCYVQDTDGVHPAACRGWRASPRTRLENSSQSSPVLLSQRVLSLAASEKGTLGHDLPAARQQRAHTTRQKRPRHSVTGRACSAGTSMHGDSTTSVVSGGGVAGASGCPAACARCSSGDGAGDSAGVACWDTLDSLR